MNKKQKIALLIGVVLLVLIGLLPPWKYTYDLMKRHSEKPAGFALIFQPPQAMGPAAQGEGAFREYHGVHVDLTLWLVEFGVLAVAVLALFFILQDIKPQQADSDEQSSFFEIVTDGRFVQTTPGLPEMTVEEDELTPERPKNIPQEVLSEDDL
ncbi:MAG: hypothetical protein ACYDBB_09970 [Armatimonadota bacterium]